MQSGQTFKGADRESGRYHSLQVLSKHQLCLYQCCSVLALQAADLPTPVELNKCQHTSDG